MLNKKFENIQKKINEIDYNINNKINNNIINKEIENSLSNNSINLEDLESIRFFDKILMNEQSFTKYKIPKLSFDFIHNINNNHNNTHTLNEFKLNNNKYFNNANKNKKNSINNLNNNFTGYFNLKKLKK